MKPSPAVLLRSQGKNQRVTAQIPLSSARGHSKEEKAPGLRNWGAAFVEHHLRPSAVGILPRRVRKGFCEGKQCILEEAYDKAEAELVDETNSGNM